MILTKHNVEKTVKYCMGSMVYAPNSDEDYAEETVAACEKFAMEKFGVSLAELLFPSVPLIYLDLIAASNEPDFPEAAGPDVTWEKD